MLAVDWGRWYLILAAIGAAYLLWAAVFEKGHQHLRWLRDKASPPKPADSTEEAGRREPYVVLGHPGGDISKTPLHELAEGEHSKLRRLAPRYLLENKEPSVGIRDVTTGVRTRDSREHRLDAFFAGLIGPGEDATVSNAEIPPELFEGVHESEAFDAFLYWARFSHDGVRWEVVYDPRTQRNTYTELPLPHPQLDARVQSRDRPHYVIEIANVGDTTVTDVECLVPDDATNWHLLTEALATYPIRALDPDDRAAIPLSVTMGGPAAIEATLTGKVDGVPYQRVRTLSLH